MRSRPPGLSRSERGKTASERWRLRHGGEDVSDSSGSDGTDLRVFVVADTRIHRDTLAAALGDTMCTEVVGVEAELPGALPEIDAVRPTVVVLDLEETAANLIEVQKAVSLFPKVKFVACGVACRDQEVLDWAQAGVEAIIDRERSIDELVATLHAAANGEFLCSPRIATTLLHHVAALARRSLNDGTSQLSDRELEIAALIAGGLSNKEIARRLSIQVSTVKNHVHRILEKLQVNNRAGAAALLAALNQRPPEDRRI
jgi:two-component system, NarL family, nitrate/nitrite response regulator NarL